MKIGVIARGGLVLLAGGWAVCAQVQAANGPSTPARSDAEPPVLAEAERPVSAAVIREIDDPHTGDHWLLMRDPDHPGAPGRMVLASSGAGLGRSNRTMPIKEPISVIHAGDRLVVEESSALVEARLEAVALGQAANGAPLNVRLTLGGKVVRAIALGPGRAAFALSAGGRP